MNYIIMLFLNSLWVAPLTAYVYGGYKGWSNSTRLDAAVDVFTANSMFWLVIILITLSLSLV